MAINSCKGVDLFCSPLVKERDAYETGRSMPLYYCDRIAPHAILLASVVIQKGLLKSGYFKIGGF